MNCIITATHTFTFYCRLDPKALHTSAPMWEIRDIPSWIIHHWQFCDVLDTVSQPSSCLFNILSFHTGSDACEWRQKYFIYSSVNNGKTTDATKIQYFSLCFFFKIVTIRCTFIQTIFIVVIFITMFQLQ